MYSYVWYYIHNVIEKKGRWKICINTIQADFYLRV